MRCFAGTFCPEGSSQPIPCTPGQYCASYALPAPTGDCDAGYYCNGSDTVSNPQQCSLGYYCPQGTPTEQPCVPGTFNGQ